MPRNGKPSAVRSFGRLQDAAGAVPPTGLVLLSIGSVQLGAAIAKGLFEELGPTGTVFLRVGFAALVLLILWRPSLKGYTRRDYLVAGLFGLALAAMNMTLYLALDRIPLGAAVTLEFAGPLGVAVAGSRRLTDLVWAVLAAAGILLLAPLNILEDTNLDPVGVALALLAGCFWASASSRPSCWSPSRPPAPRGSGRSPARMAR
jgi:inner membrane transporter RhtA